MLNIQVEPRMCRKTEGLTKMRGPKIAFSTGGFADLVFPRFWLSSGQIPVNLPAFGDAPGVRPAQRTVAPASTPHTLRASPATLANEGSTLASNGSAL